MNSLQIQIKTNPGFPIEGVTSNYFHINRSQLMAHISFMEFLKKQKKKFLPHVTHPEVNNPVLKIIT